MKYKDVRLEMGVFLLILFTASSCKSISDMSGTGTATAAATSTTTTTPPVGVSPNNAIGFNVSVTLPDSNSPYYFHEQSSLTAPCTVPQGTAVGPAADIYCILDVQELDLYFGGVTFNYNLPASMCNYFELTPYDFFTLPVATPNPLSPTNVVMNVNGNTNPPTITSQTVTVGGAASALAASYNNGAIVCPFDYSTTFTGGPNCCVGTWSLSLTTGVGAAATTSNTTGTFTGSPANCLAGPAVATQPKDLNGFPETTIYDIAGTGLAFNYAVASPISLQHGSNIYPANWFTPTSFANANNTLPATTFPLGIKQASNPYYQFSCMDRAEENIARIRVVVRSWDTLTGFTAQSNPYTPGINETQFGGPLHDRGVWDDTSAAQGGSGYSGYYY